jgi:predicted negative regulator of RcsB-dependent stress response
MEAMIDFIQNNQMVIFLLLIIGAAAIPIREAWQWWKERD